MLVVWLTRNELVFQNKVLSSPKALIFRIISFAHGRKVLLKDDQKETLKGMVARIAGAMEEVQDTAHRCPTGICSFSFVI